VRQASVGPIKLRSVNSAYLREKRFMSLLPSLVEFIDENGGGPGVRLRKRHLKKS
jgi:hypothetical protein